MSPTFVHEFTSPINRYKALAVQHGLNVYPVAIFEGRECYVSGSQRIRQNVAGRGYFNSLTVNFIDNGETRCVPAGKFAKAKNAPLPKEVAA